MSAGVQTFTQGIVSNKNNFLFATDRSKAVVLVLVVLCLAFVAARCVFFLCFVMFVVVSGS